ncbi:hypothetical protein CHELA40_11031 [Chelatococcus asaccharovorans]|nr:hypothetical protein CHELA40_11031 [Chelatococcus asaccharovorans]CAH1685557.1 hypothetical protein CHELA17_64566 [Chelatococcus asaccharovorans]
MLARFHADASNDSTPLPARPCQAAPAGSHLPSRICQRQSGWTLSLSGRRREDLSHHVGLHKDRLHRVIGAINPKIGLVAITCACR